jgi:hypothetical protein
MKTVDGEVRGELEGDAPSLRLAREIHAQVAKLLPFEGDAAPELVEPAEVERLAVDLDVETFQRGVDARVGQIGEGAGEVEVEVDDAAHTFSTRTEPRRPAGRTSRTAMSTTKTRTSTPPE